MANFLTYGIKVPGGATGNVKTICPNCTPHNRKPQNRNSKDLSVEIENGLWHCHNCGWSGSLPKDRKEKVYVKPVPRLEKLKPEVIESFEKSRGISNNTLLRLGVTEAKEYMAQHEKEVNCICFNYYRGEDLINIKFRAKNKAFKMAKDAELIFYNLNSLEGKKDAVIVEGEIDCLTMREAGIFNSVSVPNGATKNSNLEYLDNCWQLFEGMEKIVIAVDGDEAGSYLKEELGRRLGKVRCWLVEYPEGCKDANEVLLKHGKDAVRKLVEEAKPWPLEGIIAMDDMYEEICNWFISGYPEGTKAGIEGFDELISFVPGQLTMVTGIPGSGKDEFLNLIASGLCKVEQWSFGVVGFEEPAPFTVTKLMEKISGKAFGFRKNPYSRMTTEQFRESVGIVDKYFHFVNVDLVGSGLDGVLDKLEELVRRFGIRGAIINPWNCLDHKIPKGHSETQYISECLTKILNFARRSSVHVFLVAHPTKIRKNEKTHKYDIPTLYHISGSAHFFNKTHNGICVYRDFETNVVDVYVQKVKWSWLGKLGFCSFNFNTDTRQYEPLNI